MLSATMIWFRDLGGLAVAVVADQCDVLASASKSGLTRLTPPPARRP